MYRISDSQKYLSPEEILKGYSKGIFPMGDSENGISWFEADPRAIVLLPPYSETINISRSLKQVLQKNIFKIRIDISFEEVIKRCAKRNDTWINKIIIENYTKLHKLGYAHSVEAWSRGKLAGGLYGVALNGAFFGESMFHEMDNASKVCVVSLYNILLKNKFILFDIQMSTPVFESFGAVHISKEDYLMLLKKAMSAKRKFVL